MNKNLTYDQVFKLVRDHYNKTKSEFHKRAEELNIVVEEKSIVVEEKSMPDELRKRFRHFDEI